MKCCCSTVYVVQFEVDIMLWMIFFHMICYEKKQTLLSFNTSSIVELTKKTGFLYHSIGKPTGVLFVILVANESENCVCRPAAVLMMPTQ